MTAVSASLRAETKRAMPVTKDITVIPNFIDGDVYQRRPDPALRARFAPSGERLVIHLSNLRPVKQVDAVVRVFAQIQARVPARLLIVGEGPELGRAEQLIDELGVNDQVELIGEAQDVVGPAIDIGSVSVAIATGKLRPVGARGDGLRRAGGGVERRRLPEVVVDGVTGFLHPPDDVTRMAESAIRILSDPVLHAQMAADGVRLRDGALQRGSHRAAIRRPLRTRAPATLGSRARLSVNSGARLTIPRAICNLLRPAFPVTSSCGSSNLTTCSRGTSPAERPERHLVATDQRFFLFTAPPFQLMLARDGACCRWVLLGVDHSHGPSVCGVHRSTSPVVRLFSRSEGLRCDRYIACRQRNADVYERHRMMLVSTTMPSLSLTKQDEATFEPTSNGLPMGSVDALASSLRLAVRLLRTFD